MIKQLNGTSTLSATMSFFVRRHLHPSSLRNAPRSSGCVVATTPARRLGPSNSNARGARPFATYGRRQGQPGQGGVSEERMIAQSIRTIGERKHPAVVEVMNACHVDWASRNLPSRTLLRRNARVWMRVLTHADLLSDEALRYQMERASIISMDDESDAGENDYRIPVVAVNISDAENAKTAKGLRAVKEMLLGAKMISSQRELTKQLLVCGLPNAGKSSLIYPLTKHRTMSVKKKKDYHLPKINKMAGWTLGTKSHVFDIKILKESSNGGKHHKTESVTLTDTPGMRPRLEDILHDKSTMARWLATLSLKPQKGDLSYIKDEEAEELRGHVVDVLWQGLKRHAHLSGEGEDFGFASPEDLWSSYVERHGDDSTVHKFIHCCHEGDYGAMIIEDEATPDMMRGREEPSQYGKMRINPDSAIVAMNQPATALVGVGQARRAVDDERNSRLLIPRTGRIGGPREDRSSARQQFQNQMPADATLSRGPRENESNARLELPKLRESNDNRHRIRKTYGGKAGVEIRMQPPRQYDTAQKGGGVTVYVGNLSYDVDAKTIREAFAECGEIVAVRLAKTHPDARGPYKGNEFRGFGHVDFANPEGANRAVELAGSFVAGRPIRVDHDRPAGRDRGGGDSIVRLPEHQQRLECMKCAGFIKTNKNGDTVGTRHTRVINWDEDDIRAFYSRMTEAFRGEKSRQVRYLMLDSLVLTLKNKHQLSSRRKVYKKYKGKELGGYPVRSEDRPRRFRSDQPVPLAGPIVCMNRSKSACKVTHEVLQSVGLVGKPRKKC